MPTARFEEVWNPDTKKRAWICHLHAKDDETNTYARGYGGTKGEARRDADRRMEKLADE